MRCPRGGCMIDHNAREFEVREEWSVKPEKGRAIDVDYLPILRYKDNKITNNCNKHMSPIHIYIYDLFQT